MKSKKQYEKTRKLKRVSFNREYDKELLEFADNMQDFSGWVKEKLREEQCKTN